MTNRELASLVIQHDTHDVQMMISNVGNTFRLCPGFHSVFVIVEYEYYLPVVEDFDERVVGKNPNFGLLELRLAWF